MMNSAVPLVEEGTGQVSRTGRKSKRSGRHGARNQHRHKSFARWLLQRFSHVFEQMDTQNVLYVVEVAGGRGELAARLSMCHQISVVMVDPRKVDVAKCFEQLVMPKLPKKHQQRIQQRLTEEPQFVKKMVVSRVRQLVMAFDEQTLTTSEDLKVAVENASLLIGMHADGATEAIVDAALRFQKPFVVVPCCVFPNHFSQRMLMQQDGKCIPVRTHEQFCQYLSQKDPRFEAETLPFEGRNVGIWWDGGSRKGSE